MMRLVHARSSKRLMAFVVLVWGLMAAGPRPASADGGPVIAVPGKIGVPVMINGVDASYAVVEGDWGLGKSTHVQPTVILPWRMVEARFSGPPRRRLGYYGNHLDYARAAGQYYPRSGRVPGYGRLESAPRRGRPAPAESYERAWGTESPNYPATMNPLATVPQITIDPSFYGSSPDDGRAPIWRRPAYRRGY